MQNPCLEFVWCLALFRVQQSRNFLFIFLFFFFSSWFAADAGHDAPNSSSSWNKDTFSSMNWLQARKRKRREKRWKEMKVLFQFFHELFYFNFHRIHSDGPTIFLLDGTVVYFVDDCQHQPIPFQEVLYEVDLSQGKSLQKLQIHGCGKNNANKHTKRWVKPWFQGIIIVENKLLFVVSLGFSRGKSDRDHALWLTTSMVPRRGQVRIQIVFVFLCATAVIHACPLNANCFVSKCPARQANSSMPTMFTMGTCNNFITSSIPAWPLLLYGSSRARRYFYNSSAGIYKLSGGYSFAD